MGGAALAVVGAREGPQAGCDGDFSGVFFLPFF